jgi:hypothetical protein
MTDETKATVTTLPRPHSLPHQSSHPRLLNEDPHLARPGCGVLPPQVKDGQALVRVGDCHQGEGGPLIFWVRQAGQPGLARGYVDGGHRLRGQGVKLGFCFFVAADMQAGEGSAMCVSGREPGVPAASSDTGARVSVMSNRRRTCRRVGCGVVAEPGEGPKLSQGLGIDGCGSGGWLVSAIVWFGGGCGQDCLVCLNHPPRIHLVGHAAGRHPEDLGLHPDAVRYARIYNEWLVGRLGGWVGCFRGTNKAVSAPLISSCRAVGDNSRAATSTSGPRLTAWRAGERGREPAVEGLEPAQLGGGGGGAPVREETRRGGWGGLGARGVDRLLDRTARMLWPGRSENGSHVHAKPRQPTQATQQRNNRRPLTRVDDVGLAQVVGPDQDRRVRPRRLDPRDGHKTAAGAARRGVGGERPVELGADGRVEGLLCGWGGGEGRRLRWVARGCWARRRVVVLSQALRQTQTTKQGSGSPRARRPSHVPRTPHVPSNYYSRSTAPAPGRPRSSVSCSSAAWWGGRRSSRPRWR